MIHVKTRHTHTRAEIKRDIHNKPTITNESGLNPKQPSNRLSKSLLHTIPSQLQFRFDLSLFSLKIGRVLSGSYTYTYTHISIEFDGSLCLLFSHCQMSSAFSVCGPAHTVCLNGKWPRVSLFIYLLIPIRIWLACWVSACVCVCGWEVLTLVGIGSGFIQTTTFDCLLDSIPLRTIGTMLPSSISTNSNIFETTMSCKWQWTLLANKEL